MASTNSTLKFSPMSRKVCLAFSRDHTSLLNGRSSEMISFIFFSMTGRSSGVNGWLR